MRHAYRPALPPKPPPDRTQLVDPLGLVAGMFAARGIAEVRDRATEQAPARRRVPAGPAGKAMGRHGLGLVTHPRSLVPHGLPHTPRSRRLAPGLQARQRHDDPRGRALDPLSASGVTALSRLLATTAAPRWGRAPTGTPRASPRCQGDGRAPRAAAPDAPVVPSPPGARRAPRPDRHHGLWAWSVAHPAGIAGLLQPRRGPRREAQELGHVVRDPRAPLHTPARPLGWRTVPSRAQPMGHSVPLPPYSGSPGARRPCPRRRRS
jgi:hypothetical protein